MRHARFSLVGTLSVLTAAILFLAAEPRVSSVMAQSRAPGGWVDVHIHLDGVQAPGGSRVPGSGQRPSGSGTGAHPRGGRSAGGGPPRGASAGASSAEALIALMDRYGVEKAIVMPPPQGPGQPGGYDYRVLAPLVSAYPSRLALAAGGGTLNRTIVETDPAAVTADVQRRFDDEAEAIVRAGAVAFGEMTAMHFCLNPRHHYIQAPPDHPLLLRLADIAARHRMPIDLHMEALAQTRATPESILTACSKNPDRLPATIPAFERLLAHNRNAKIVWQHVGWDNTGEMTIPLLRRLLSDHPNLYLAIKATEPKARPMFNVIADANGRPQPEWVEFLQAFPDRVVVGADEFARGNVPGGYAKPPFFAKTWQMVAQLPPQLVLRIARDNAMKVYRLQ